MELGRAIYAHHAKCTGDGWWRMAKRAEVSDVVCQRFLGVTKLKPQNGRSLANVEAIFEAMGHALVPIPSELAEEVRHLCDQHYAAQLHTLTERKPDGSTPDA